MKFSILQALAAAFASWQCVAAATEFKCQAGHFCPDSNAKGVDYIRSEISAKKNYNK
jgi:hypothetical protein